MTIKQQLQLATSQLKNLSSARPDLEAQQLLGFVVNKPRAWFLAHSEEKLTSRQAKTLASLIKKRLRGEPLAYLLGQQEFYGLPFKVNKNVLIPRPETEQITQHITHNTQQGDNLMIADIGTGSGAIIISLAKNLKNKNSKYLAIDISAKALAVAKQNAKLNNVAKDIVFLKGNLLEPLIGHGERSEAISIPQSESRDCHAPRFRRVARNDRMIVVANLPYLKTGLPGLTKEQKQALSYEPKTALFSGADGLNHYRRLARQIAAIRQTYPRLKLTVYCEADPDQLLQLKKLLAGAKTKIIQDFRCQNRFLIADF